MKRTIILSLLVLLPVMMGSGLRVSLKADASPALPARSASQLYSRYCISCHGQDGKSQTKKGRFSHARNLTDAEWQDDVSDERLFNSIMNGRNVRGNMPAFSNKLNDQEAESLVGFVRRFRK
jgi:mono/diheme cytochrome c family protein